jgi:putative membrane protein
MNRTSKFLLSAVAAGLACLPLQAQMMGHSPAAQAANDPTRNGMTGNNSGVEQDSYFLNKAAAGGMSEVAMGKLALEKSSNEDVKKFAQKMVDDHTAMGQDVQTVAKGMNVNLPDGLMGGDKKEYAKLQTLSGPAFDKEYMAYMVKDHKKDLADFKSENASTQNPQIKDLTAKGEAVIQGHLETAEKIDGSVKSES